MYFLDLFFIVVLILSTTILFVIRAIPSSIKKTMVIFSYCLMLIFAVLYIRFSFNQPYSLDEVVEQAEHFAFDKSNFPKCKRDQYGSYTSIQIDYHNNDFVVVAFEPKSNSQECKDLKVLVDRLNLEMWIDTPNKKPESIPPPVIPPKNRLKNE